MENKLRPYPPTGMTTQRWRDEVPVVQVALKDLLFTQEEVSLIKVLQSAQGVDNYAGDDFPHVVGWRGRLYLEDGHHRIALKLLRGEETAAVRLLYV